MTQYALVTTWHNMHLWLRDTTFTCDNMTQYALVNTWHNMALVSTWHSLLLYLNTYNSDVIRGHLTHFALSFRGFRPHSRRFHISHIHMLFSNCWVWDRLMSNQSAVMSVLEKNTLFLSSCSESGNIVTNNFSKFTRTFNVGNVLLIFKQNNINYSNISLILKFIF